MSATYKGANVTVLRPITPDEAGFVEGAGDQVLIRMSDGTECVVAKGDLQDSAGEEKEVGDFKETESDMGGDYLEEKPAKTRKTVAKPKHKAATPARRKKQAHEHSRQYR